MQIRYTLLIGFILLLTLSAIATNHSDSIKIKKLIVFDGSESNAGKFIDATAIDLDNAGNIFIVDRAKHRLVKFTPNGHFISEIGGFGDGTEKFDDPRDVSASATVDVFVADFNNDRVVRFDRNLNFLSSLSVELEPPYIFEQIKSVTVSSQYDLFVLEGVTNRIIKFTRFSDFSDVFGGPDESYGQLLAPHQICLQGSQKLYVSDPGQEAIVVFDYLGNFLTQIKHPELTKPTGIYWSADKQLYVIDEDSNQLFIFSKNLKFINKILLDPYLKNAVDVAIAYRIDDKSKQIYILTPENCTILR
jgi:DNA-binding beta-propeller fold protein YncE